jgi:uncharacterized protein YbjQ (UPF0145 family)
MARPFSSDLSVAEAFVVREAGFTPIAQVMGSCFYQVGWQSMPWGQLGWTGSMRQGDTFELETQTAAWNDARSLALGRLRDEAVAAGADAVVGLRLRRGGYDWAAGLVEFVAIGTAVRSERYAIEDAPVLSHLPGQDFAKLVRHGFWPVGLVAGSTVAYVVSGYGQQTRSSGLFSGRQNQELPDYTRGMYDARALAMERVTREAHRLHAHGVVGVTIERSEQTRDRDAGGMSYRDLIIELHVLGTAIVEVRHDPQAPTKYIALPLDREVP